MNIGQIVAEITATTTGLRKAQQDANKQFGQIQNEANTTSAVVKAAFAVAGSAAVLGFVAALAKATDGANETRKAMMGLESTTKAFGQNFNDANKSVKELYSDGLMPLDKSIRGFKNLLSVGFSVEEALQLSKSLKDIGAFNNVVGDLGQAYEDSTKGLKTGSMELIENIGLTQRLSTVMKKANVDISNGIDITNNAAQRRAVYNAILAEGAKFEGNAAKLANDNAAASAKMSAAIKNLSDEIGNKANPYFSSFLGIITEVTKATAEWAKGTNLDKVTGEYYKQREELGYLSEAYFKLKGNLNKTKVEQEIYLGVIDKLKTLYPDYLKNLDLENISNATMLNILKQINSNLEIKYLLMAKEAAMQDNMKKAAQYREAEKKQLEEINRLETDRKNGKPANLGIILAGGYDKAIKNAKNLASIYKKSADDALKAANQAGDYWQQQIEKASGKNIDFKEPDWLVKMKADIKKRQEEEAKKKAEPKAEEEARKKAEFKPDMEKTLAQKKAELEYKMQADLINAKKEEEYLIGLKYQTALKVLDAEDKFNKAMSGAKTQEAVKKARDELIKSTGELELNLAIKTQNVEDAKKALGILDLENYGIEVPIQGDTSLLELELERIANEFAIKIRNAESAVGLTDVSNYGVPAAKTREDEINDEVYAAKNAKEVEDAFNDLDSALKNMVDVIDNDVISALYSLGEGGKSFINSFKGFQAGQTQGGLLGGLGMLTGGIGMFTSAVSIFQTVGGLFGKSTYNFEEAVQKMLKGIGEKAPELQIKEYEKALNIKNYLNEIKKQGSFTQSESEKLKSLGATILGGQMQGGYAGFLGDDTKELLGALEKIIPQLAEQLGTTVQEFGSDIASALNNAGTFEVFSDNLEDNVFSSVKSGLISAFMASEAMKPLLDTLQQSMTIAVADDYKISDTELTDLKGQVAEIENIAKPFYDALEAVGLNLVDASDSLADATDNFSSTMNRNLKLAERISKDSLGNSQIINIDLAGANLGGMNEANIVNSLNKAVAMSNIVKVGVR